MGTILALGIIKGTPRLTDVDIFTDCQPAVTDLSAPKPQLGQYLLATFHQLLQRLLRAHLTLKVRLRWVPAHIGIAGNEAIDARTKEAALGSSSPLASRITTLESPLLTSKAAALAAGAKIFRERWLAEWSCSPRFHQLSLFDTPKPSNAIVCLYTDLSHPQCSVLTQLRTTHFALNSYLYHFCLGPSPNCALCLVPETVPHFLLACPAYCRQRLRLIMRLGTARLSLRPLLSAKSQPKLVLDFVRETGRFPRYVL
jgi:hypothetical protein